MNETESPILHISGTLREKDYKAYVRSVCIRYFLMITAFYLIAISILSLCIVLYNWFPYLRKGYISIGELFLNAMGWLSVGSLTFWMIIGFIGLYTLYSIVIRPTHAVKKMRELYPEGVPYVYDFFEDHMVIQLATQITDQTIRLKYDDVRRKIKDTRHVITLSTDQRNRLVLYKAIMTPDQAKAALELLRARCPQRRS